MSSKNKKPNLFSNNIFLVIISLALAACIAVLAYFLISTKSKGVSDSNDQSSSNSSQTSESSANESVVEKHEEETVAESPASETAITLTTDYSKWNESCSPELILVNANNPLPSSYNIELTEYSEVKINKIMSEALEKMIYDANHSNGLNLWISSVYRSIELQTKLFNRQVKEKLGQGHTQEKAENLAAQEVARPGYSEHNTGLAVDFNGVRNDFKSTAEYKWLCENSYKYGFVLRYPEEKKNFTGIKFEPWHFRFVGVDVATNMKSNKLCFEEYVSAQ